MNTHSIIYTFIDSQNLNLGTGKDIYKNGKLIYKGWRLDFKKFRDVKKGEALLINTQFMGRVLPGDKCIIPIAPDSCQ